MPSTKGAVNVVAIGHVSSELSNKGKLKNNT
jgi:hypothetical protein